MPLDRATAATRLAQLLHQTAEDHHIAFKQTDGVDPVGRSGTPDGCSSAA